MQSALSVTLEFAPDAPTSVPRIDNGRVHAIAVGTTHVYVGGTFTTVNNGIARAGLAAFHKQTGALDVSWDPGLADPVENSVRALVVDNGKVYVGGRFKTVRGGAFARSNLVAFAEATGSTPASVDQQWDPNADNVVWTLAVSADRVYVGGAFETVNGSVTRNALAAFSKATGSSPATVDAAWNPNLGKTSTYFPEYPDVTTLAVYNNRVYVGGYFDRVNGGITRNYLAAFEVANGSNTGAVDSAWNPNPDDEVFCLAVANNRVYAGGWFESVGGGSYTRYHVAAFSCANGSSPATVDPWNPMMNATVYSLAVNGGRVFLGGTFTTALNGTETRTCIAAFNEADGSSAAVIDPWNPIASIYTSYYIFALAPAADYGVYLGGDVIYIGGKYRYRFAGYGTDWNAAPRIQVVLPAAGATAYGPNTAIDVTFSENVYAVDAGDMVLTGTAASGAVVGTPSLMQQYPSNVISNYREMWRFPVTGLGEGDLQVQLAPDPGDIVDNYGKSLDSSNTTWNYTAMHASASLPFEEGFESAILDPHWDSRGTTI
jgi:hypothetical protein